MSENITTDIRLSPLNQFDIRLHPLLRERLCEEIINVRVRVQTRKLFTKHQLPATNVKPGTHRDELEDKAELPQLPNILLHLLLSQTRRTPVEARAQVVRQPMTRSFLVYSGRKLLRLSVDWRLRLHPE